MSRKLKYSKKGVAVGRHGLLALKARSAPAGTSPEYHPELEASKHLRVLNATGGLGDPNRGCQHTQGPGSVGTFAGVLPPHPTS